MKNDLPITVQLPPKAIIRAMLERCLEAIPDDAPGDIVSPRRDSVLPAIGGESHGGHYAGLTVQAIAPAELILLPGEFEGTWEKAKAWAEEQGGTLPSRFDALVLWKNLRDRFKPELYWTDEQTAGDPDWAWCQSFGYGDQLYYHKGLQCRVFAVRRIPI